MPFSISYIIFTALFVINCFDEIFFNYYLFQELVFVLALARLLIIIIFFKIKIKGRQRRARTKLDIV
jgi:hypothetical protein